MDHFVHSQKFHFISLPEAMRLVMNILCSSTLAMNFEPRPFLLWVGQAWASITFENCQLDGRLAIAAKLDL